MAVPQNLNKPKQTLLQTEGGHPADQNYKHITNRLSKLMQGGIQTRFQFWHLKKQLGYTGALVMNLFSHMNNNFQAGESTNVEFVFIL